MKKLTPIILIIFLLFTVGCSSSSIDNVTDSSRVTVTLPTDDTVNGYRITSSQNNIQDTESAIITSTPSRVDNDYNSQEIYYMANINSKKFHLSTCSFSKRISEENLFTTENRQALINDGYKPCKACNP